MQRLIDDGRVKFGLKEDSSPKRKLFYRERLLRGDSKTPSSILLSAGTTKDGSEETAELVGKKGVFDYPKPVSLLTTLLQFGSSRVHETLVLDFFAGSGTTGHAVMAQNAADGGTRRYILVQLPEPLDPANKEQKTAADFCDALGKPRTIAELTKERLRRAAKKVRADNPLFAGDTGFRVYKLDSSNIRPWDPHPADAQRALTDSVDNLKLDRSEADFLAELMLKLGLDLCERCEKRVLAGFDVWAVGGGELFACFGLGIGTAAALTIAEGIAVWRDELQPSKDVRAVFRDGGFVDDVAKANLAANLKQRGIQRVQSL